MSLKLSKQIGLRLEELRKSKGYTLDGLAYECGLTKAYLSMIQNGKRLPSLEKLEKISKALGAELKSFF